MANSGKYDMLSPGLVFNPRDDDIVGFFLKRAVMGVPLPTAALRFIRYVDVYGDKPPWEMFLDFPATRVFFVVSSLKKLTKGRSQRRGGGGTWKRQSVRREIAAEGVVGEKYTLSFVRDEQNAEGKKKGSSTGWNMTEYRLLRCIGVDVDCNKMEGTVFCKIVYSGKESFDSWSSVSVGRRRGRNDRDDLGEVIDEQTGNKKAQVNSSCITISVAPPPPGGGAIAAEEAEMGDDDDAFITYLEGQLETDDALVVQSQSEEEEAAAAAAGSKIDDVFLESQLLEKEEDAAETQMEEEQHQAAAADVHVDTQLEEEEHQAADDSNTIVDDDDDEDGYLDLIDFDVSLFHPDEEDEPGVGIFPIPEDETASNAEMITGGAGGTKRLR